MLIQPDDRGAPAQRRTSTALRPLATGLAEYPERGTRRDDIRTGLRVIGFERRVAILFEIDADGVAIGRILYGGQDLDTLAFDPEH